MCQVALRGEVVQASNVMHTMNSTPPKRSFIHVCLLIPLFSILVFGCLESDDCSCRRLQHCSLVNSSIKSNRSFANNEVLYSEAMLCGCKFQFRHVLSQRLLPMGLFSVQ